MLEETLKALLSFVGYSMQQIAQEKTFSLQGRKGDIGHIVEQLLGVKPSNFMGPDIPELGLEVKTIPLSRKFKVLENTFVQKITLPFKETVFESSQFLAKARNILFVPIIGDKKEQPGAKTLGQPFVWTLEANNFNTLKKDWIDLSHYLRLGLWSEINSTMGEVLHIRPKAAHGQDLTSLQAVGQVHTILPMGFYIRKSFTQSLIESYYA